MIEIVVGCCRQETLQTLRDEQASPPTPTGSSSVVGGKSGQSPLGSTFCRSFDLALPSFHVLLSRLFVPRRSYSRFNEKTAAVHCSLPTTHHAHVKPGRSIYHDVLTEPWGLATL